MVSSIPGSWFRLPIEVKKQSNGYESFSIPRFSFLMISAMILIAVLCYRVGYALWLLHLFDFEFVHQVRQYRFLCVDWLMIPTFGPVCPFFLMMFSLISVWAFSGFLFHIHFLLSLFLKSFCFLYSWSLCMWLIYSFSLNVELSGSIAFFF